MILEGILLLLSALYITEDNSTAADLLPFGDAREYELAHQWGFWGNEDGQFDRPHALDFSPLEDKIYVVDRFNYRIQVFDKEGNFLFKWGENGPGDGEFLLPYGVDVDKEGNVWVADRHQNRIQKFDPEGNFLFSFGAEGTGNGEFKELRHLRVDNDLRYLYAVDSGNDRIQKFDINGNFIKAFGTSGNKSGEFDVPISMVIDSDNNLYVNERGNERVQKLDTEGNPILEWGGGGSGQDQFCHIEHMAVDKFDNIYVADAQLDPDCVNHANVKKFDNRGNLITLWDVAGEVADPDFRGPDPEHVVVDSEGNVYLSERANHVIQVYKPVK